MTNSADTAGDLAKRYICNNGYSSYGRCYSTWDSWARWVVFGLVVFGALFIFFLFSCISARRRKKMGYVPYRGTGWAANGYAPPAYSQTQQQPYYANNQAPAPPAYGAANDYYGRQNDVELQQPQQAYGGYPQRENQYAPPTGPPPQKNDGIIR